MTNPEPNAMDVLTSLLEERRRYEGWLAQLEGRRASTPPHVFDKVRADYEQRLRTVMDQLGSRASELEATVRELQARASSILAEENARRDERAEAELRAMVGEYTPDEASELLARTDEAINAFAAERAEVVAELERLQDVLAQVQPATAPETESAAAPAAPAEAPAAVRPANPTPAAGPIQGSGSFDELAFLQSVVEPRGAKTTPAAPAPAAAPAAPPAPASQPVAEAAPRRGGLNAGTPAFLKGMPAEQVKTLKCQECGTMNYATEWYCERCGGELAAM